MYVVLTMFAFDDILSEHFWLFGSIVFYVAVVQDGGRDAIPNTILVVIKVNFFVLQFFLFYYSKLFL